MAAARKRTRYSCEDAVNILMNGSDSAGSGLDIDSEDSLDDNSSNLSDQGSVVSSESSNSDFSDEDHDVVGRRGRGRGPAHVPGVGGRARARGRGRGRARQNAGRRQRAARDQPPIARRVGVRPARGQQHNNPFDWQVYEENDPHYPDWLLNYRERRGVIVDTLDYNPVDYFHLFFPVEAIQLIVDETNRYALQMFDNPVPLPVYSRFHKWEDTDEAEIKAYIALQIAMGLCQKPEIEDYWGQYWLSSIPFADIMCRNRYELLSSFLHFTDNGAERPAHGDPDFDNLWKIRPLMTMCERKYLEVYSPSRDLSIDESIIRFKGRVHFRQYLPSKPYKWGIKQFALCDSKTGYTYKLLTYCGKGTLGAQNNFTITECICLKLLEGFENKGHRVFTDNFYTSPNLFRQLEQNGIGACGTVKAGRQHMPHQLKASHLHLEKGFDPVFMRAGNLVTCAWHDTKRVHFLSNIHTNNTVDKEIRSKTAAGGRRLVEKPVMADIYNSYMGGVDIMDQKLQTYAYPHKSAKWYFTIYNRLREVALVNSYIVYTETKEGTPMNARQFRENVIDGLLEGFQKKQTRRGRPSNVDLPARLVDRHFVGQFGDPKHYPDCIVCSSRTTQGWKRKQTRFNCVQCNLAMCPSPCHEIYHTYSDFKEAAARIVYNL